MRNFPKNLKTKEDVYNCLEMVREGKLSTADLTKAINKIKNQNYINAEIIGISEDRKTVTTRYLAEANEGSRAKIGATIVTVKAVTHIKSEPDEQGNTSLASSEITVSKAVAKSAETFALEKIPPIYDKYGMTENELDTILDEIAE